MKPEFTVRIANENDAEPFAKWIAESHDIPVEDVRASLKEANPTSVTLVIEYEGEVVLFAPSYAVAQLGFIGFNPEADPRKRIQGLEAIKRAVQAFWGMHGVTSIATLTKEGYPVAKWALHNGFVKEERQVFVLSANPESVKAN